MERLMWHALQLPGISEEYRMAKMRINGQVPGKEFFLQLFSMDMNGFLESIESLPFLHIHGEQDDIVMPKHADRFEHARRNARGRTKFLRLPHSDHDFSHPQEQLQALELTCQWFCETL